MCDPLTIGGIALSIGSTVANTMAQNKVQKARDEALAAERIRQNKLDQEAQALNVQSQDRYQGFEGKQEDRSKQLGDYFASQQIEANDAANAGTQAMVLPQSGSNVTVQEEAKQRGQARDFTDKTGAALGELRSFGDLLGGISRDQARDATQVGVLGGFKRGSSNVVPYELEAANQAGNGMKLFGDVLGLGGGLALNSGLSGAKLPGLGGGKSAVSTFPSAPGASNFVGPNLQRPVSSSLYNLYNNKGGMF